ncbi:unnamed protein product [Tetraodon nigroviridis]|uniref:Claudin n=1 Tax=Tetraodon nigroviridis TaxID=99883 RepID=Q4S444_TETNG|nr:unnamed protein product [Tetraodon nigroviridis]
MDPIVEVVALVLGFLGWVMVGVCLPNRHWKTSTVDGNVITTSTIYENLWMSCATDSTGVHNCREFPSLLALNGYIQASRALMITAVVLGSFGLVAALIGVQCSKAGGDNYVLKGRIAGTAGVLFILQGLCTLIAISWYAANITREFFDPFFPGTNCASQVRNRRRALHRLVLVRVGPRRRSLPRLFLQSRRRRERGLSLPKQRNRIFWSGTFQERGCEHLRAERLRLIWMEI